MLDPRANLGVALAAAMGVAPACHPLSDCQGTVPEGTAFKVTVLAPSAECPEIVPLKAGDTLTLRAGPIVNGRDNTSSNCEENQNTGVPAEFPQFPVSPFLVETCSTAATGEGFSCEATAPNCAIGDGLGSGSVSASFGPRPKPGEVLHADFTIGVYVGADLACRSSCFTKIPITIERL